MTMVNIEKMLSTPIAQSLVQQSASTIDGTNTHDFETQLRINLEEPGIWGGNIDTAIASAISKTAGLGYDDSKCKAMARQILNEYYSSGVRMASSSRFRKILKRALRYRVRAGSSFPNQEENQIGKVGDKDRGDDSRTHGNWGTDMNRNNSNSHNSDFLMRPGDAPSPNLSPFSSGLMSMAQDISDDPDAQHALYNRIYNKGEEKKRGWSKPPLTPDQLARARTLVRKRKQRKAPGPEPMSGIPMGWESGKPCRDTQMGNTGQKGLGQSYDQGGRGWDTSAPSIYGGTDGTYGPA